MGKIIALLDFPDTISFSEVPVRHTTSKTLLVRNIGNRDTKFRIETDGPFDVEPSEGFIKAAQSIQVDLRFHPKVWIGLNFGRQLTYLSNKTVHRKL